MKLEAKVSSILFPKVSPLGGTAQWYVLLTTGGKIVGSSRLLIKEGHTYTFEGDFETYQGQLNFKFKSLSEEIPCDPRALLDYACMVTKGLGPAYADSCWHKHGADYHSALKAKEHLAPKERSLLETLDTLAEDSSRTEALAAFISKGATPNIAELAYARFGNQLTALLQENIYILAELPGQSFRTVDERFRAAYGVAIDSPVRVAALAKYLLDDAAESTGDTVIPYEKLLLQAADVGINGDVLREVVVSSPALVRLGNYVTTKHLYDAELALFQYFNSPLKPENLDEPIAEPEGMTLDESQLAAISAVLSNRLTVINGGAGCGKTTIIKTIAQTLQNARQQIAICAFAGKASARIREATGFPASTIHSLLRYVPEMGFTLDSLAGVTVIIDESSMVPAYLLAEITKRNPKRLVLVGDESQLPPVGAGAPFHDLVALDLAKTVTTCYRNAEAIFQGAYAVRNGKAPVSAASEHEAFTIVGVRNPDEAQKYISEQIIPLLDFEQDIIIAPRNGTKSDDALPASVNRLNAEVMRQLEVDSIFQPGARIICTKNNPEKNVWNGTTATVQAVDTDGQPYILCDEGHEVHLPTEYAKKNLSPAYALTIHKAQGSQYRRVVIVCLRRDMMTLLDRQMLYTAITRAKEGCLIVTDIGLDAVVAKSEHRNTILAYLFQEALNETALN